MRWGESWKTVMSGSVSRGKNDPSQSLQMIERPLMTPDELKSMPKGQFVVMKTGAYPMKVRLKLYFKWGITFHEEYSVEEKGNRGGLTQRSRRSWTASYRNTIPTGWPAGISRQMPCQRAGRTGLRQAEGRDTGQAKQTAACCGLH